MGNMAVLRAVLYLAVLLGVAGAVAAESSTELRRILASPAEYEGKTVVVTGEVESVNYAPEIRNGKTLLSFTLDDTTGRIKVINPNAALLGRHDRVRAVGIFTRPEPVLGVVSTLFELDSSSGGLEILKSKTFDEIAKKRENPELMAVQTTVVDNPWSITVDAASILSAFLAAVASIPLFLRSRRFNLGLAIVEVKRELIPDGAEFLLLVSLRLISTKSIVPQLNSNVQITIDGVGIKSRSVVSLPSGSEVLAPIAVGQDLAIRIEFPIPENAQGDLGRCFVIQFQDAFCGAKFTEKIGPTPVIVLQSRQDASNGSPGEPSLSSGLEAVKEKAVTPAKARRSPKSRKSASGTSPSTSKSDSPHA